MKPETCHLYNLVDWMIVFSLPMLLGTVLGDGIQQDINCPYTHGASGEKPTIREYRPKPQWVTQIPFWLSISHRPHPRS